jgi:hypothetical protein
VTKYLRKTAVANRYQTTPRNVDRMWADGRIPPPDFYNGRFPLWNEAALDANDAAAAARPRTDNRRAAKLGDAL